MARKTSGDSSLGVSGIIFRRIQDSFTTQAFAFKARHGAAFSRLQYIWLFQPGRLGHF
jgi:hypothetical protein